MTASHPAEQSPVVIITGAAQRIGARTARHFHDQGFRVIIHYRRSLQAADSLCAELNRVRPESAVTVQADLDDFEQVTKLAEQALAAFGRLDVLVNNASSFFPTPLGTITIEQWHQLMGSNALAPLFLSQALAPALTETRGCIINLADMNAERGMAGFTPYTMAKAALLAMTQSLARELAPAVRVNSVSPGAILWPEYASDADEDAEKRQQILAGIPAGRLGTEDDIAATVFFLATHGHYITGENIRVDGGRALA